MATNNAVNNSSAPFTVSAGDLTASGTYSKTVGATAQALLVDSTGLIGGLAGAANTIFVGGTKPSFTATPQCTDLTLTGILKLPTTSSTVGQIQINSVRYIHAYGTDNFFMGNASGNFTLTGQRNNALGNGCLSALTSGYCNTSVGQSPLLRVTTGWANVGIGCYSAYNVLGGSNNTAVGNGVGARITSGSYNTLVGYSLGNGDTTRDGLQGSGYNYTGSESSNICIMNDGTTGESNKIRIGTQGTGAGQQNAAYIAGIYNTAVGATAGVVLSDSTHQLGGLAGSAGQVLQGGTKPAFSTATYPATTAQGDLLLSTSANTIQALAKDTNATRYLSNTGTSNNAAWAQVALATGVSGTLPASNGGRNAVSESTTSNSVQMAVNTTYIATSTDGATLVTYTLPATAAVGDQVKVIGKSTAFWKVAQNATDTIHYAAATSTPGATGYASTAQTWASATFTCITASSIWVITEVAGTVTLT